ncbi:hypothetical protein V2J09_021577 [Rumex salicifolius]
MESSEAQTPGSAQSPPKPLHSHSYSPSDRLDNESINFHPSCSTKTPMKLPSNPPRPKRIRHSEKDKLPEQHEMLIRLFNGLDSALRLLQMRKSVPYFTRIRATVEGITGRRFAHRHLAQMKYLMPEQILIKRVSSVDEVTGCMKRDLHVALIRSIIKNNKKRKRGIDHRHCVKKLFRSKLLKFLKRHSEGTNIPEEVLPVPFNEQMLDPMLKMNEASSSCCSTKVLSSHVHQERPQASACHVSRSFRTHFSRMNPDKKTENLSSNILVADDQLPPFQAQDYSPYKKSPSINTSPTTCSISSSPISPPDTKSSLAGNGTPQVAGNERMPVKFGSSPGKLMINTPALQPQPRSCSLSPDDDNDSTVVAKSVNRPSAARSLNFDCLGRDAHIELELDDVESTDILDILPQSLVQSLKENEKKTEEQTMRRRKLNSLPKLFDRIYYLFQSIKYSSIRKEALLHRLTTCHSDIVDESEVEEQLKLLQEVLPDWISQKLSPSSNILLSSTIRTQRLMPNGIKQHGHRVNINDCNKMKSYKDYTSQQVHRVEDQALSDTCSNMHSTHQSQEPECTYQP